MDNDIYITLIYSVSGLIGPLGGIAMIECVTLSFSFWQGVLMVTIGAILCWQATNISHKAIVNFHRHDTSLVVGQTKERS